MNRSILSAGVFLLAALVFLAESSFVGERERAGTVLSPLSSNVR